MKENKNSKVVHDNFEIEVESLIPNNKIFLHPKFEKFLNIAKTMSEISNYDKYRLGAVIVVKGRVIARGYNKAKSHPLQKRYNIERVNIVDSSPHDLHAEIDALTRVKGVDLKNAELFVYHINNLGQQKMVRPCAACMTAIKEKGISVIHYSTTDGLATEYISTENKTIVKRARKPI